MPFRYAIERVLVPLYTMRLKIILVVGLAACGVQQASTPQVSPSAAITETSVRDFLSKLADDSMEGRRTGTRGNDKAARFIASEMKSIGLVPLGDSSYFQKVAFAK